MNFFYKNYDALCVDIFEYIFHWRTLKSVGERILKIDPHLPKLLWMPAQRKRASMLYFADVFFIYFFMATLFSGPAGLTELRESFTRGGPWV